MRLSLLLFGIMFGMVHKPCLALDISLTEVEVRALGELRQCPPLGGWEKMPISGPWKLELAAAIFPFPRMVYGEAIYDADERSFYLVSDYYHLLASNWWWPGRSMIVVSPTLVAFNSEQSFEFSLRSRAVVSRSGRLAGTSWFDEEELIGENVLGLFRPVGGP